MSPRRRARAVDVCLSAFRFWSAHIRRLICIHARVVSARPRTDAVADELVDELPPSARTKTSTPLLLLTLASAFGWDIASRSLYGYLIDAFSYHAFLPQRQSSTATKSHEEVLVLVPAQGEEICRRQRLWLWQRWAHFPDHPAVRGDFPPCPFTAYAARRSSLSHYEQKRWLPPRRHVSEAQE